MNQKNQQKNYLDEYCTKILTVLTLHKDRIHYNELHRELENRMKLSKPTLSAHLNHLIEKGFVLRKEEEGTQYVTYSLNLERAKGIKNVYKQTYAMLSSLKEDEKEFYSLSEENQIEGIVNIAFIKKLEEIRARIELALEPDDFQKVLRVKFLTTPLLGFVEKWIIKKSVEDPEYREKIFKWMDEWQSLTLKRE